MYANDIILENPQYFESKAGFFNRTEIFLFLNSRKVYNDIFNIKTCICTVLKISKVKILVKNINICFFIFQKTVATFKILISLVQTPHANSRDFF